MAEKLIEEKINESLRGDSLANALDLAAFIRANGMGFTSNDDGEGWAVGGTVGDSLGYMMINGEPDMPGPWTFWFNSCDFGGGETADVELKETAWAHSSVCANFSSGGKICGCGDQPGLHGTIFGREFENRCHSPLMFTDPGAKTLEHLKKLILMLK